MDVHSHKECHQFIRNPFTVPAPTMTRKEAYMKPRVARDRSSMVRMRIGSRSDRSLKVTVAVALLTVVIRA